MTVPVLQTQSRESVSELTHYGGERFHDHLQVGYGDDGTQQRMTVTTAVLLKEVSPLIPQLRVKNVRIVKKTRKSVGSSDRRGPDTTAL
jgi:P2-related tail formation protein